MKILYDPPSLIKNIFFDFLWKTKNEKILLTFDDGPNPGTLEIIMERLQKYNLKAVFFCVGNNIKRNPNYARELISEGHQLANHTFNHQKIMFKNRLQVKKEIEDCQNIAKEILNYNMKYFRPPHGLFDLKTAKILREYNLQCIMWSLLTYDFENDLKKVKYGIDRYLQKNSIVTMHDNNKCKKIIKDSIDFVIEKGLEKGFEFTNPEEALTDKTLKKEKIKNAK